MAELLRSLGPDVVADSATVRLRLWAARVSTDDLPEIHFDNAPDFGLSADDLVAEDYAPTQNLAQEMREAEQPGFLVPSAALPGTRTLILLGPRLLFPYLQDPIDPDDQVRTAHAAESAIASEVLPWIRWKGDDHWALEQWRSSGVVPVWSDPPVPR